MSGWMLATHPAQLQPDAGFYERMSSMDQATYEAAANFTTIGDAYLNATDPKERLNLRLLLAHYGGELHARLHGLPTVKKALCEFLVLLSGNSPEAQASRAAEAYRQLGAELLNALTPQQPADASPPKPPETARHSADFTSVHWYGDDHEFTANQAKCVGLLWQAWENGTPSLRGDYMLAEADVSQSRFDLVFRGHAAWGTMIVPSGVKGSYKLSPPVGKTHG